MPGGFKGITMSLPTPITLHHTVGGVVPFTCDESTPTVLGATTAIPSSVNPSSLPSVLNCNCDFGVETTLAITEASCLIAEESIGCTMFEN